MDLATFLGTDWADMPAKAPFAVLPTSSLRTSGVSMADATLFFRPRQKPAWSALSIQRATRRNSAVKITLSRYSTGGSLAEL
ncbi:MAG: hypothetical protein ACLU37_06980 [Collinsella sp.]